jgi:hypothetical protein
MLTLKGEVKGTGVFVLTRTIGDSPDQLEWSISGVITEYRGANYLLVTQAVLKTKGTRSRRGP